MRSLRARLLVLWALSLAASLAVGLLLVQLYRQSSSAEAGRAELALSQACDAIGDRYGYFVAGWAGPPEGAPQAGLDAGLRRDLAAVVGSALAGFDGIEGGMWQPAAGVMAAPDGRGGTLPWQDEIAALARAAAADDQGAASRSIESGATTVLLRACPLSGPIPELVAWTLARVAAAPGYGELRLGVGVLLALVLLSSLWLTALLLGYARRIGAIERALAGHESAAESGVLPAVALTGERDLDRIVAALNRAGRSLAEARARSAALSARVAAAERLAALGRVAAGVAHEIRNPIAAMRLRAENALAGDPARSPAALQAILGQIARLDRLIAELLEMTRAREPQPAATEVAALLRECAAEHADSGDESRIVVESPESIRLLDSALLRRALDNLVQNALRHAAPGTPVVLRAALSPGRLALEVIDQGPGVPEALRGELFEPFVTGHADGTGLGLAIAREMAQALGGSLALANPAGPTVFRLEIPAPEAG